MKRYLHDTDYEVVIQNITSEYEQYSQLQQVTQNNHATLVKAELIAQEEAYAWLIERYNLSSEFTNTGAWVYNTSYNAADRVIMDYAAYSTQSTYSLGDCVIYNNEAYALTGTNSVNGTFSSNYWSDLGPQYTIYYVSYPAPMFDYHQQYRLGDLVFWSNHIWSCNQPTFKPTRVQEEQYVIQQDLPYNIFPDAPINSTQIYWIDNGTYSTPLVGGSYSVIQTLPTNTTYWTQGDNRSQLMVINLVQIALYYLNKTISPMNVPEHRVKGYKDAIDYLKEVAEGKLNSPVLQLQPDQGMPVRYGGNVRKTWFW